MTLATVKREYREIPLGLLDPPRLPSRVGMDDASLNDLARDIRLKGLIVPLIVAAQQGRYEIVAGHRRSIAAARAGLVAVMCCVFPSYETALVGVQYTENRFRENLTVAEEAILFSDLLERECGGDVDRLCALLGETRYYVEKRLLLFTGCQYVFKSLLESRITLGVAEQLNKCADETMRRYFLDAAIRGGATVAIVAGWVQQWRTETGSLPVGTPTITPAAPSSPVPQTNYFTCYCCGKSDNVHLMQPVNMHTHCKLAILDPLMASARGEG